MVISKSIAQRVTDLLSVELKKEIQLLQKESASFIEKCITKSIDKKIMELWNSGADSRKYINNSNYFEVRGIGITHYESEKIEKFLPCSNYNGSARIILKDNEAEVYVSLLNTLKDKKKELENIEIETKATLLALKTYKRTEQEFPEAYKLLPQPTQNTLPVIQINKLKAKLKL